MWRQLQIIFYSSVNENIEIFSNDFIFIFFSMTMFRSYQTLPSVNIFSESCKKNAFMNLFERNCAILCLFNQICILILADEFILLVYFILKYVIRNKRKKNLYSEKIKLFEVKFYMYKTFFWWLKRLYISFSSAFLRSKIHLLSTFMKYSYIRGEIYRRTVLFKIRYHVEEAFTEHKA